MMIAFFKYKTSKGVAYQQSEQGGNSLKEVLRQEKKYLITIEDYYRLSAKLEKVLHLDGHSSGDGYQIRSLYFDSLDDIDWQEKEEGLELRKKIRLRNYGSDSAFAKLEMKQKQGSNQKKRSLSLKKEDALALVNGNYSVLLEQQSDFALECFYKMSQYCYRPKTIIEYTRKAFVAKENNIRITFDHHIIGTESSYNIFANDLLQYHLLDPALVILEVKYNGFLLSYIKDLLEEVDGSELSASKYCMGRMISKHYRF